MHCMLIANLHIGSKDVYINAHMVIIMNNIELLRLLMILIGNMMIQLLLIKLNDIYSLHREFLGDGLVALPCTVL